VAGARRGRKPDEGRRAEIARLRKGGLTYAEIGRRLGVTRQCVQRMLLSTGKGGARPVACRACGAVVVGHLPGNQPPPPVLCPACLARQPAAPFADCLRTFRLTSGLTRTELARRAGFRYDAITRYESGASEPRPAQLARLVRVLGPGLMTAGVTPRK
jgi:transcriptional regulator with XRE-family HTH domain